MNADAQALLNRLRRRLRLEGRDYALILPAPPRSLSWDRLGFDVRTRNTLSNAGFKEQPAELGKLLVRDAMNLRGFGISSLVAYLEAASAWPDETQEIDANASSASASIEGLRTRLKSRAALNPRDYALLLPRPPMGVPLELLGFDRRTTNALKKAGFDAAPDKLGDITVGGVLALKKFGVQCLCSYLEASSTWSDDDESTIDSELGPKELANAIDEALRGHVVLDTDPRFRMILRKLRCSNSLELTNALRTLTCKRRRFAGLAREFLDRLRAACALTVESEALDVRRTTPGSRNASIIREYFGFTKEGPRTLNDIGDKVGVTRERIRQICSKGLRAAPASNVFMPALRRAIAVIESSHLVLSHKIENQLARDGVIEPTTSINALMTYAQRLNLPLTVKRVQLGDKSLIVDAVGADQIRLIRAITMRLIHRYGAATAQRIAAESSRRRRASVSSEDVASVASIDDAIRRSSADEAWLCNAGELGKVFRRRVARILAVGKRLSPQELRQALRRDYREGAYTPPIAVLTELICSDGAFFSYVDGYFSPRAEVSLDDFGGSPDERAIVQLLMTKNGVAERRLLQKEAEKMGVSGPSYWRCLSYSTLITRFGDGVYGLVGARLPPGLVDDIQASRTVIAGGMIDRGWMANGELWLAYRLSDSSLETGIVGSPAALRDLLIGDFKLQLDGMGQLGQLTFQGGQAWGLRPALVAAAAEAGDCIVIRLNRMKREAVISVGDESLVDEFAEST